MNITVRNATTEDADAIASFQIAMALETEQKVLAPEIVGPAVRAVFHDPRHGFYLVAEFASTKARNAATSKVVGSLLITYEWSDWRNGNMWYIQSVFVDADYRGRGVFKQLYASVIEAARLNNVPSVRLYVETENESAQKVYESLGMKRMPYYLYDVKL